jgi:hypothetical protein
MPRTGATPALTASFSTASPGDSSEPVGPVPKISSAAMGGFSIDLAPGDLEMIESLGFYNNRSRCEFLRVSKACYLATVLLLLSCVLLGVITNQHHEINSDQQDMSRLQRVSRSRTSAFCTLNAAIPNSDRDGYVSYDSPGVCGTQESEFELGDVCDYECDLHYKRGRGHVCNASGYFVGGSCTFAGCYPPRLNNDDHINTDCEIGSYGDQCVATCAHGYTSVLDVSYKIAYNFTCSRQGWAGGGPLSAWPGFLCTDINECAQNNGGCEIGAVCTNTDGGFVCNGTSRCPLGYSQDEHGRCTLPTVVQCDVGGMVPYSNKANAQNQCRGEYNRDTAMGTPCNFSCDQGYTAVPQGQVVCLPEGAWPRVAWQGGGCKPASCNDFVVRNSDHDATSPARPACTGKTGSQCTYMCDPGFGYPVTATTANPRFSNTGVATCGPSGEFTNDRGVCTQLRCNSAPGRPSNSIFSRSGCSSNSPVGTHCIIQCQAGFELVGSGEFVCEAGEIPDGDAGHMMGPARWEPLRGESQCRRTNTCPSGQTAGGTCKVRCDETVTVEYLSGRNHANLQCQCAADFDQPCQYRCDAGYEPTTTPCICLASGHFSNATCLPIQCTMGGVIANSSNRADTSTQCSGSFGQHCRFACAPGFEKLGRHTCRADGHWSGGSCVPLACATTLEHDYAHIIAAYILSPAGAANTARVRCIPDWEPVDGMVASLSHDVEPAYFDFVCTRVGWQIRDTPDPPLELCQPVHCYPQSVLHGTWAVSSEGTAGQVTCSAAHTYERCATAGAAAVVLCHSGYVRHGSQTQYCQPDGTWGGGGSPATCVPVPEPSCTPLVAGAVAHGTVITGGRGRNSYAGVMCASGFDVSVAGRPPPPPPPGTPPGFCDSINCALLQCQHGHWVPAPQSITCRGIGR